MRVSAIGVIANTINDVMVFSKDSAMITHNHLDHKAFLWEHGIKR